MIFKPKPLLTNLPRSPKQRRFSEVRRTVGDYISVSPFTTAVDAGEVHNGSLRWGKAKRVLIKRLFEMGTANPLDAEGLDYRRAKDADYLKTFHDKYPKLQRHSIKNYYQNVRHMATEF
jgi:hypothetical protein